MAGRGGGEGGHSWTCRLKCCAIALLDCGAEPHAADQVCVCSVWWAGGVGRGSYLGHTLGPAGLLPHSHCRRALPLCWDGLPSSCLPLFRFPHFHRSQEGVTPLDLAARAEVQDVAAVMRKLHTTVGRQQQLGSLLVAAGAAGQQRGSPTMGAPPLVGGGPSADPPLLAATRSAPV